MIVVLELERKSIPGAGDLNKRGGLWMMLMNQEGW